MRRTGRLILILILFGGAAMATAAIVGRGLWTASPSPQDAQTAGASRPAVVAVEQARRGDLVRTLSLTGEIVATESVTIAATKEGRIVFCPWREGDEVGDQEKLIAIERQTQRAEVDAAEAALAVARAKLADLRAGARPEEIDRARANVDRWQATLEKVSTDYQRQKQLHAGDFTSQQSLDEARERLTVADTELAAARQTFAMLRAGPTETQLAVQEAQVQEAAARAALARAHLDECLITAPFEGTVSQVHVRAGDLATARAPLLEMYNRDSLVVRFAVPEAHAAKMRAGLGLQLTIDALPGRTFTARVLRAHPQLDQAMRTRTVDARLDEPDEALIPHMFARLNLELERVADAVLVPAEAIVGGGEGESVVFIVAGGRVERREVVTGLEQARRVAVLEGVEPGERVVVQGHRGLQPGDRVRVVGQAEQAGADGADRGGDAAGREAPP